MMRKILIFGTIVAIATLSGCSYWGRCVDGDGPVIEDIRETGNFTRVKNTGSFDVYVTRSDDYNVVVKAQESLIPIIETNVTGNMLIIELKNNTCVRSSSTIEIHISMPEAEELSLDGSGRIFADLVGSPDVEISNSGSGLIEIDSVIAQTLELRNSGSGHIEVNDSQAEAVDLIQSGSGSILSGTLVGVDGVDIRHSSSGRIRGVFPDLKDLDVVMSGSGRIELGGSAAYAEYALSSSGSIDSFDMEISEVNATNTGSGNIYVWASDILDATIAGSGDIIYIGNPVLSITITGSGNVRPY